MRRLRLGLRLRRAFFVGFVAGVSLGMLGVTTTALATQEPQCAGSNAFAGSQLSDTCPSPDSGEDVDAWRRPL